MRINSPSYDQSQEADLNVNDDRFESNTEEKEWNAHFRLDYQLSDKLEMEYEFYYTNYLAEERLPRMIMVVIAYLITIDTPLLPLATIMVYSLRLSQRVRNITTVTVS